ncbi:M16 family metallopeptidase [Pseudoruegeria sp. SHC-113]|uniref:M16 family metallopeptidase n=1 Tax=Pseudoruegeria sp. SHC-113 TaxID=2855439 RepID=UPI0021BB0089|nr:pitrilysin family protein [Pseudoruegeria sp. SHC-113]MCT8159017.1 insulinase family protein [Pseudoruegeria sp. SHC-113]
MRRILSACVLFLGTWAAPLFADENVTTFTLDNGMDVLVLEDHRAPVAVQMVWYRAGAADEPPGTSGIAHFLEHLLFKGTDKLEAGEFSRIVAANGGTDNAFTSWDYTAYFQRIAADRLELMMEMESNRMRNIRLTEEDILTERQVILEERNQRTDSEPGALFGEQRRAAQYLNHPYGIPIIGWRHEMETLDMEDALTFYERFYAPNNAILIVAGDVDPEEVRRLAETYYGPIAPTEGLPERARPQEPPQLSERRLTFSDPRVSQPYVTRSYLAPQRKAGDQQEAAALTLLASLLGGNSTTSVLARKLQFEEQTALYTAAFYDGGTLDDASFGLVIVPQEGVSLQEAEEALDGAIEAFIEEGVDPAQFERIKTQIKASEIYARDDVQSAARRYGMALTTGLTVEDVQAWPDVLMAVTEEDVIDAAKAVFDKRRAVTGWLMREEAAEEVTQ